MAGPGIRSYGPRDSSGYRFPKGWPFTLSVEFEDETVQIIDFRPVLAGEMLGPLADTELFDQVHLDPEADTLVWPNGADFDPATLHDWPEEGPRLAAMARQWRPIPASTSASTDNSPSDEETGNPPV